MKTENTIFVRTVVASSLLLAFSSSRAEVAGDITQLTKPNSAITIGVQSLSDENRRFGQFNGLTEKGVFGQLDMEVNQRDESSGAWTTISGSNLGQEDGGFRLEQSIQGNWRYFVNFDRTPRYEPLNVSTRLTGVRTPTMTIPGTGQLTPVDFKTVREKLAFGLNKQLNDSIDLSLRMQTEEKTGTRFNGANSTTFAPEPINSTTNQWEAKLGFTGENLQLSGGYYGSRYSNVYSSLTNGTETQALPPDNFSHQLYLSGGYNLTPTTRSTFKVSITRAEQDEGFFTPSTIAGLTNLGARLDTTLATAGVTAKPIKDLNLLASVRFEDRDDETPRHQFLAPAATRDGFNITPSRRSLSGKVEAGYRLPDNYKLVGGVDFEDITRNYPTLRQSNWREKTEEVTSRVELRKSLAETLNGTVKYAHSKRDGSQFAFATDTGDSDVIAPIHWSDRTRDKVKIQLEWAPLTALSVQMSAEQSKDKYKQLLMGPERGTANVYSLDASYALSDDWQLSGWYTQDETIAEGGSCENNPTTATFFCGQVAAVNSAWQKWHSRLTTKGDAAGLTLKGKLNAKLSIGMDAEIAKTRAAYQLRNGEGHVNGTGTLPGAATDLPEHQYRLTTTKLYTDYAYRPDLSVRATALHQRSTTDDWQWTDGSGNAYFYGAAPGNTTVSQTGVETVNFFGVSLTYKWW